MFHTTHSHNNINHNSISIRTQIQSTVQIQVDTGRLFFSDMNGFINFLSLVLRHEERDTILKSLS